MKFIENIILSKIDGRIVQKNIILDICRTNSNVEQFQIDWIVEARIKFISIMKLIKFSTSMRREDIVVFRRGKL